MKEERQRQIKTDAIIKCQNFLVECRDIITKGEKFSMYKLARFLNLSVTTVGHSIEMEYFVKHDEQGMFSIGKNFDCSHTGAKKLIESVRLKKVKQQHARNVQSLIDSGELAPVSKDNTNNDKEPVPKIDRNTGHEIASVLKKALANTQTLNNQSLFSGQEKEYEDKLKIACAIASGMKYQTDFGFVNEEDISIQIIYQTNDLYNRLKNNK